MIRSAFRYAGRRQNCGTVTDQYLQFTIYNSLRAVRSGAFVCSFPGLIVAYEEIHLDGEGKGPGRESL